MSNSKQHSSVNDQIIDAVLVDNTLVAGSGIDWAMIDTVSAQTIGLQMQQAVQTEHQAQINSLAALTATCSKILSTPLSAAPAPQQQDEDLSMRDQDDLSRAARAIYELTQNLKDTRQEKQQLAGALEDLALLATAQSASPHHSPSSPGTTSPTTSPKQPPLQNPEPATPSEVSPPLSSPSVTAPPLAPPLSPASTSPSASPALASPSVSPNPSPPPPIGSPTGSPASHSSPPTTSPTRSEGPLQHLRNHLKDMLDNAIDHHHGAETDDEINSLGDLFGELRDRIRGRHQPDAPKDDESQE